MHLFVTAMHIEQTYRFLSVVTQKCCCVSNCNRYAYLCGNADVVCSCNECHAVLILRTYHTSVLTKAPRRQQFHAAPAVNTPLQRAIQRDNNNNEYLERLTRSGPKRLHTYTFFTHTYCQNSTHTT